MVKNKYYNPPNVSEIIPRIGCAIVITSVDHAKNEGTYKLFDSVEQAIEWRHESSLKTYPKWHEENCTICKMG